MDLTACAFKTSCPAPWRHLVERAGPRAQFAMESQGLRMIATGEELRRTKWSEARKVHSFEPSGLGSTKMPSISCSLLETLRPKGGNSRKPGQPSSTVGEDPSTELPPSIAKEAHKYFDQVVIMVQGGHGGNGSLLKLPRPSTPEKASGKKERALQKAKEKANRGGLKRGADGMVVLPMGGHGGDVILFADDFTDSLLDLHKRKRYAAKRGNNVNIADGLTRRVADGLSGDTLRIPVPVGTVVKRKRGGKFLADLTKPGDEVLVARGGRGGISIMDVPEKSNGQLRPVNPPKGATVMTSLEDKKMTIGLPGEEIALELTLRVVADVGFVGLPNAGKSSLLAAVTAAKPDIAAYPFTTLMPNLGRLEGNPLSEERLEKMDATLADLPGLIEGAHLGKGLGRMFLRHLRRTRLLLHLVDASAPNPLEDYRILREELRLYNEEYTTRPHIVVLNKLDLPEASMRFEKIKNSILGNGNGSQDGAVAAEVSERSNSSGVSDSHGTVKDSEQDDAIASRLGDHAEFEKSLEHEMKGNGVTESREWKDEGAALLNGDNAVGVEHERGGGDWEGELEHDVGESFGERDEGSGSGKEEVGESEVGESEVGEAAGKRVGAHAQMELPVAIVGISAKEGQGIKELLQVVRAELAREQSQPLGDSLGAQTRQKVERLAAPQWQI